MQGIDRTLADKVFAVCDYYLQGKVAKHSRHLYDIYKLLPLVPQDENFKELVKEVRAVREQSVICPSALPEANVPELLEKIIKEKAYKQDYDSLTTQLLEENVPYDTVIATLKKVAESSIFENADGNMSKEEFIRQRDAYRVQEDEKIEQIQRLRTEKDQIFLPVRKDADNLQTVVSAAEEAGDVMHLSQNVVETFIDRIEVFNDERVKIRFTFKDALNSYEEK